MGKPMWFAGACAVVMTSACGDSSQDKEALAGDTPQDGSGQPSGSGSPSSVRPTSDTVADHAAVDAFATLPAEVIEAVAGLHIYYGHTSHGSQLVTGVGQMDEAYQFEHLVEEGTDLGSGSWHTVTDQYLADHPETEVVVWSWCGQQANNSTEQVQAYLDNMAALEETYPDVAFIYMTGHLRGAYDEYLYDDATNEQLQENNRAVLQYCTENNKWLFDFADIESYRDGESEQCVYHDMAVECTWSPDTTGCAHSRMPNCVRKGKAFYWLLARITGWEPSP